MGKDCVQAVLGLWAERRITRVFTQPAILNSVGFGKLCHSSTGIAQVVHSLTQRSRQIQRPLFSTSSTAFIITTNLIK